MNFAMRIGAVIALLGPWVLQERADAMELADGKLSLNSYGYFAYVRTDGNTLALGPSIEGNRLGQYDNAGLAVMMNARPYDNVVIATQFSFDELDGSAPGVDFAFAEYRVSDALRLRAGKMRQPLGISAELIDVGTTRPFFTLPMSVYGPSNVYGENYLGAGATGSFELSHGWALGYDVYLGGMKLFTLAPEVVAASVAANVPVQGGDEEARDVVGARLVLQTPVEGLSFRLSGYGGSLHEDTGKTESLLVVGVSAEYLSDAWSVRAEAFRETENEGGTETNYAGYGEVAYRISAHWQVAGRVDLQHTDAPGFPGASSILRYRELAAGLDYWVTPGFVLKASYHNVDGNRFAFPAPGQPLKTTTNALLVGSQFSF